MQSEREQKSEFSENAALLPGNAATLQPWHSDRIFVLALALGLLARLIYVMTSIGTLDALLWFKWVELVNKVGILKSYLYSDLMNHPPLALLIARETNRIGLLFSLQFNDSFRIVQSLAEIGTAVAIFKLAQLTTIGSPRLAALLYYLSPVAIWISGFHCNSDPLMVALLLTSLVLLLRGRIVLAGLTLAAACGIKILPVFALPFMLMALPRREAVRFFLTFAMACAVIFIPGLIITGPVFLKNIFGYTGMKTGWGVLFILNGMARLLDAPAILGAVKFATPLLVAAWVTLIIRTWTRGKAEPDSRLQQLPVALGLIYLIIVLLAPGFGVQYLLWPLPFLPFILRTRHTVTLHIAFSSLLFAAYTIWSNGWPWWFAGSFEQSKGKEVATFGFIVWLLIGAAIIVALRRDRGTEEPGNSGTASKPTEADAESR